MSLPASAAHPAAASDPIPEAPAAHVRVRVGDCHIAIAASQVERALAIPAQGLSTLPRRQGAVAGLIDLGGRPVPVVSLERWLPMGEACAPAAQQRVLVLHTARARIGLRVDEVMGVKAVDLQDIVRVHHDGNGNGNGNGNGEELFESVVPASADAPILSVLEVDRLMALCQVWCEDEVWAGAADAVTAPQAAIATAGHAGAPVRHALFAMGDELWAVPASGIHTVVPLPPVELNLPGGGLTVAISELRGRKLPLVSVAGQPARPGAGLPPWVAVLEREGQWIGLIADACRQLADLAESDLALTPGEPFLKGIVSVPDVGMLRVLDIDQLFDALPEAAMSLAVGAAGDATANPAEDADAGGEGSDDDSHFLVFEAGALYASPVDSVVGVVELPQPTIDELVLGRPAVMPWRGKTLKVVALPSLDGQQSPMVPRMAILLEPQPPGHATVGIAISRLCDWLPARRADHQEMRLGSLGEFRMITHEHEGNSASMVVVDLGEMAYLLG